MKNKSFNKNQYIQIYEEILRQLKNVSHEKIEKTKELILKTKKSDGKILIAGNGGSHAIASHLSADFTKACLIPTLSFSEPSLITCLTNDLSYEEALSKFISSFGKPSDLVILISSSGNSRNIIIAAEIAKKLNMKLVIFSGFSENNKVAKLGDVNIHIPISHYNIVENVHQIILTTIVDDLCNNFVERNIKF